MLRLPATVHAEMLAHALRCHPLEACGLFAGRPGDGRAFTPGGLGTGAGTGSSQPAEVVWFAATDNVAASSKLYTVDPRQHLAAERRADDDGLEVLGVMHSHTHTEPYPSPTDVAQAVDPGWHYVIVSLRDDEPMLRSWRIVDGVVEEEPVVVIGTPGG